MIIGAAGLVQHDPQLDTMTRDGLLHQQQHHLCGLGIQLDTLQDEPSAATVSTLCTRHLPAIPCCGKPQSDHINDWSCKQEPRMIQRRMKTLGKVAKVLLSELAVAELRAWNLAVPPAPAVRTPGSRSGYR